MGQRHHLMLVVFISPDCNSDLNLDRAKTLTKVDYIHCS